MLKSQNEELRRKNEMMERVLHERDKEKELTEEPKEEYVKSPFLETRISPIQEEEPDVTKTEPAMMEAQNKYVSGKLTCSSVYRGQ